MGDAVIFALLFMTYGIMVGNTAGGPAGKALFSLNNAALETALLLVSSTTFGFASLSSRRAIARRCWAGLLITFLLGAGFVFLEIREFLGHDPRRRRARPQRLPVGLLHPGRHPRHPCQRRPDLDPDHERPGRCSRASAVPVTSRLFRLGLFWHFLDIAWVGIFSVVYLPGLL